MRRYSWRLTGISIAIATGVWCGGNPAAAQPTTVKTETKKMFDSGFHGKYEPGPILVEFDGLAALDVPPEKRAAVKPADPGTVRQFTNNERNSRAGFSVGAGPIQVVAKAAFEPDLRPVYLLQSGNRVVAQGNAMEV
ncbi:MAG: hypothetical protein HY273_11180, partial [Gammaproteobacteria bacterium]|nr:hypothetical protein [Gammaproteobacteria bacterium]